MPTKKTNAPKLFEVLLTDVGAVPHGIFVHFTLARTAIRNLEDN